jgi:hypothetical protein
MQSFVGEHFTLSLTRFYFFFYKSEKKQGKKCTCNVTLWGVPLNIFPKEIQQYILCVFLSYMSPSKKN